VDKFLSLKQIEENIRMCDRCRLCKTATNSVPGEGNSDSELVLIGEAPGETEDLTGRPFVGRAGRLLETLLGKIGYKREEVWIGNIIKHRPPQNRDPLPDEIFACQPYLTEQLQILSPKIVVTLGRFALSYFYGSGKISRDRGTVIQTAEFNVFPVYHPAAALRNPDMARALEQDFLKIPGVLLNLSVPKSTKEGRMNISKESIDDTLPDGQQGLF
jgi:DNA polymerase